MIRKITLIFLLCIGFHSIVNGQIIKDSVTIALPPYMDSSCVGTQLTFTARETNDTFTSPSYHWYTNGTYTGVAIDTFITTALNDGDSVFCWIVFINSAGLPDSTKSNVIFVYHPASFPAGVVISLIVGSNPDCAGYPLTFLAYPINGGLTPAYQWMINGVPVLGADSVTFTHIYGSADTVSCMMVSNSACLGANPDTVYSNAVPIIHIHLNPSIAVAATHNPICAGAIDTFTATVTDAGVGATLQWYVNSTIIPTALGPTYITDSLHDGSLVYCIVTTPDSCVISDSTVSNIITMTVIADLPDSAWMSLTSGSNPGCISSRATFTGYFVNGGTAPVYTWYINSVPVLVDSNVLDTFYNDRDTVTFTVRTTDGGCYAHDTFTAAPVLMIRDSVPVTPLISLIGDLLVANRGGLYRWFQNTSYSYTGVDLYEDASVITQSWNPPPYPYCYFAVKDTLDCYSDPSNIICISLLEVPDIKPGEVKIYPNPTTGILNMDWGSSVTGMKVDVCNIIGQTLIHEEINNESHHETDMSHLPSGNYFIVLRSEDGSKTTYKVLLTN